MRDGAQPDDGAGRPPTDQRDTLGVGHGYRSPLTISSGTLERSYLASVLTVLVVVMLTAGSVMLTTNANADQQRIVLDGRTDEAVTNIDRRMSAYIDLLYGVRGVLGREGGVDRAGFAEFVQSLDVERRYPGVQVIGGAPVIAGDDLERAARDISADAAASGLGYPPFEVQEPVGELALPIAYVEPLAGNAQSFGFDLWGEPTRRAAAERGTTRRPASSRAHARCSPCATPSSRWW